MTGRGTFRMALAALALASGAGAAAEELTYDGATSMAYSLAGTRAVPVDGVKPTAAAPTSGRRRPGPCRRGARRT
jgi:hypothetical protein